MVSGDLPRTEREMTPGQQPSQAWGQPARAFPGEWWARTHPWDSPPARLWVGRRKLTAWFPPLGEGKALTSFFLVPRTPSRHSWLTIGVPENFHCPVDAGMQRPIAGTAELVPGPVPPHWDGLACTWKILSLENSRIQILFDC